MQTQPPTQPSELTPPEPASADTRQATLGIALLRITLGVIILATWRSNLVDDLYTSDGITGFLRWLSDGESGNASSFGAYHSFLDTVIIPNAGAVGALQLVVEFLIGLGLLLGLCTRLASVGALVFFLNLFLAYVGGHEWIWVYVLLFMSALTVFLGYGGRKLGLDQFVAARHGESPARLIW